MARFHLSQPAKTDLTRILAISIERWGRSGGKRCAALLSAAMLKAAVEPIGHVTRDRGELGHGMRSLHIRHARRAGPGVRVGNPVHVLYYRSIQPGLIEIVRVLHDRMEPSQHIDPSSNASE
jgi:toxin ParE1/3/4